MIKIWRNRIEAGTQKLTDCPFKYRSGVIALIQEDLAEDRYTKNQLKQLVEDEMLTPAEYKEITNEDYEVGV